VAGTGWQITNFIDVIAEQSDTDKEGGVEAWANESRRLRRYYALMENRDR
jgi:hypothetical protein